MREITGMRSVWKGAGWAVMYTEHGKPGLHEVYWSKHTHPDEISAYVATLKWITILDQKEQTNGTCT